MAECDEEALKDAALRRSVLVPVLQSLDELRDRLLCWIEHPTVTESSRQRPDLEIVASSNPFEIAESVRHANV